MKKEDGREGKYEVESGNDLQLVNLSGNWEVLHPLKQLISLGGVLRLHFRE